MLVMHTHRHTGRALGDGKDLATFGPESRETQERWDEAEVRRVLMGQTTMGVPYFKQFCRCTDLMVFAVCLLDTKESV